MERRDFLRFTGLASAALAAPAGRVLAAESAAPSWRTFEVTTRVEVLDSRGATRVWVPVPLLEERSFLKPLGNSFEAIGGNTRFALDPHYGAGMVCGEWPEGVKAVLELKSRFATRDVKVDLARAFNPIPESPVLLARYTQSTPHMPTGGAGRWTCPTAS